MKEETEGQNERDKGRGVKIKEKEISWFQRTVETQWDHNLEAEVKNEKKKKRKVLIFFELEQLLYLDDQNLYDREGNDGQRER